MTICFCAIVNFVWNAPAKHPTADRPLIDWDLILVMEPLTIAGALVGSLLNVLLPSYIVTILLVLVLSLTAFRSIQKGIHKYKEENVLNKQALFQVEAHVSTPLLDDDNTEGTEGGETGFDETERKR